MFCTDCHKEIKTKAHYKTKQHREMMKLNNLLQIVGELDILPIEEDEKTVNPKTGKTHNYHQYIEAAIAVGREDRQYRSTAIFPVVGTVSLYEEINDELIRQADRIMRRSE